MGIDYMYTYFYNKSHISAGQYNNTIIHNEYNNL